MKPFKQGIYDQISTITIADNKMKYGAERKGEDVYLRLKQITISREEYPSIESPLNHLPCPGKPE